MKSVGTMDKEIYEYFGRVNSDTDGKKPRFHDRIFNEVSIAHMKSPQGWIEPIQTPKFNEYTVVLKGTLKVENEDRVFLVKEGEAILTEKDESVQYSTPFEGGAEYIAVCLPAFSPYLVNRK